MLLHAGLSAEAIDFWETNETFCIVVLNCIKALGIQPEQVNVIGGGQGVATIIQREDYDC